MATPKKKLGRGRPRTLGPNPVALTIMVRADQLKRIDRLGKFAPRTRPATIRRLLDLGLNHVRNVR